MEPAVMSGWRECHRGNGWRLKMQKCWERISLRDEEQPDWIGIKLETTRQDSWKWDGGFMRQMSDVEERGSRWSLMGGGKERVDVAGVRVERAGDGPRCCQMIRCGDSRGKRQQGDEVNDCNGAEVAVRRTVTFYILWNQLVDPGAMAKWRSGSDFKNKQKLWNQEPQWELSNHQ